MFFFQWNDDEVRFVLDQHAKVDLYRASSLQQQSADRYFAPLGNITQPVFAIFINAACLAENQQIPIFFDLTRSGLEPTTYRTRGEHADHYATDAVNYAWKLHTDKHTYIMQSKVSQEVISKSKKDKQYNVQNKRRQMDK
jgi:hypothetical protein